MGKRHLTDPKCRYRTCFGIMLNKGSFTNGVGYTSYHAKPEEVCRMNHLHGCPDDPDTGIEAGVIEELATLILPAKWDKKKIAFLVGILKERMEKAHVHD